MKKDGTDITQFTSIAGSRELLPRYSPDGTLISYSTNESGAYDIVTQPVAGGGITTVVSNLDTNFNGSWQSI